PGNVPPSSKPCLAPRNSTDWIRLHGSPKPLSNSSPGLIIVSTNSSPLPQSSFNHLARKLKRWGRWTVTIEVGVDDSAWVGSQPPSLGQGVSFRTTQNQKTGRTDIFAVAPGPRPDVDVRVANGHLRRNAKGFAFVDDGFVPPH